MDPKIIPKATMEFEFTVKLTEQEAQVLSALFAYGGEKLGQVVKAGLGGAVTEVHGWAPALESLGEKARIGLRSEIDHARRVRQIWGDRYVQKEVAAPEPTRRSEP